MSVKANKYITYLSESQEKIMVIFNPEEKHSDVAKRMNVWPISAGHLTITSEEGTIAFEVVCFGESTTLGLTPQEQDTTIARKMLGLGAA